MTSGSPPVGVFVWTGHYERLAEQARELIRVMLAVRVIPPWEPIPESDLGNLAVAVVEVDPADRRSIDRLVKLVRMRPDMPVIAAIPVAELALVRTLMREGIADVIALPIDGDELTQVALDSLARRAAPARSVKLAPLIGVVRTTGGCGSTTLATHLAAAFARIGERRVALADCDLQFGQVASYLDVTRSGSLIDLAGARHRLDDDLLRTIASETADGVAVIAAPDHIAPMDVVDGDALFDAVETLRRRFDLVVIDLPAAWSHWSASLAYAASSLLIMTEVSLNSFRQAQRCLDLFAQLNIPQDRIEIVASKVEKRAFRPLAVNDLTSVVGREPLAILPSEGELLRRAQEQGLLAEQVTRKNAYSRAVADLATTLSARLFDGGQD